MVLVGAALLFLPLLDTGAAETLTSRRRAILQRRILLAAGMALGWAACTPPLRLLMSACLSGSGQTALAWVPLATGLLWFAVAVWIDRRSRRHAAAPATLFGVTLVSTITGYTLWEGFGPKIALLGLAVLWMGLLVIQGARASFDGPRAWLCRQASILLILGALLSTVALGGVHSETPAEPSTTAATSPARDDRGVPPERRKETAGRLAAGLCACAFLLVILQMRIRLQRRTGEIGLTT
jgi:hypothetical protein